MLAKSAVCAVIDDVCAEKGAWSAVREGSKGRPTASSFTPLPYALRKASSFTPLPYALRKAPLMYALRKAPTQSNLGPPYLFPPPPSFPPSLSELLHCMCIIHYDYRR